MGFLEQVYAASTIRETPEDVIGYYQEKYPGSKTNKRGVTMYRWQSQLATDMAPIAGVKRDSIMRRFQAGRADQEVSAKHQEQYKKLGKKLPPIPPEGGYHISGTVSVKYSKECVEREVDENITGDDAKELAATAGENMLQALINYYQTGDLSGKGPGVGDCDAPDLSVDPIE